VLVEALAAADAAIGEFEAATPLGLLAAFTPTTSMDRATIAVMIKADKNAITCLCILFSPVKVYFLYLSWILDRCFGNCFIVGFFMLGTFPNTL
jgi:hypothetical protein